MIVHDHPIEEGMMYLLLTDRELRRLVELLAKPKRRVSDDAKKFGLELREAICKASR